MNLIKKYRIDHWYPHLGLIFLGLAFKETFTIFSIKYVLLGLFMMSYAYAINDFYDLNLKKKFFYYPLLLSILVLPFFNFFQIIASLFFLFIVTLYSAKPFRFKAKPVVSTLINSIALISLFLIGYLSEFSFDMVLDFFISILFFLITVGQLLHEIDHFKENKKENVFTTAVYFGTRNIIKACQTILISVVLISFIGFYFNVFGIPFFLLTSVFVSYFIFLVRKKTIDEIFRKKYRIYSSILGFVYLILILLKAL